MDKPDATYALPPSIKTSKGAGSAGIAENALSLENEWLTQPQAQPSMVRLYDETSHDRKLIGTTCFFRNRALLHTVLERIDPKAEDLNVLVHAASIGCDVYSFAMAYELFFEGQRCPRLKCFATDLSPVFLEKAKNAVYPLEILEEMLDCEREFFEKMDEKTCRVRQGIRDRVTILSPSSYCEFKTDLQFDIVFLLNSLLYVSGADQARTLDKIAGYNSGLLVVTAFHPEQIRRDLERNHYQPITENLEEIYNGWTCRRSIAPGTMIDGITYCSPAMEDLRPCPDYNYRFGAIFKKQNHVAPARLTNQVSRRNSSAKTKSHLRVALFNDTGRTSHVGCKGVTLAHDSMLKRIGCDIDFRGYLRAYRDLWKGDRASSLQAFWKSDLPEKLASVDAVIVNGEGTIHHGWGLDLVTILAGAQEMNLPTFLVNAVIQECEHDIQTLKQLTHLTVRDAASSDYLKRLGVPHRIVLDSILEASFEKTAAHNFKDKIVITDWHCVRNDDVGVGLKKLLHDFGDEAVFYPLESPEREQDWQHAVADLAQARLVVTGRHHGICLAGMAGVPFVALGSNTWKIEGMLRLLPGKLQACADISLLKKFCNDALANRSIFEQVQEFLAAQLPLKTFEKLVECPRNPGTRPTRPAIKPVKTLSLDWSPNFARSVAPEPAPRQHKLCLATNYLLMTESTRQMWLDLGKQLEAEDCRLVLLSTTLPEAPLPFPVFQHPYLMRDFIAATPANGKCDPLPASPREMELLKEDISRVAIGYSLPEALQGLASFRSYSRELLRVLQPNFVMIADNMLCQTALLQRACWDADIPVQIYERGLLPETLMLESRGIQAWSDLRTHWLAQEIPACNEAAYEKIRAYYLSRKPQKYNQPDFNGGGSEIRSTLGVGGKKLIVFLGGGYEANGHAAKGGNYERQFFPAFPTTNDALLELNAVVQRLPNTTLVFKPHPLDPNPYAIARVQGLKIVKDVNVHALIDAADVVAAQYTTLQFEAALYEKPILLLARSAWWGRNATYEVDVREDLAPMVKAAMERRDWKVRQEHSHAFITWITQQFLIGHTAGVPARRNLHDLAHFIASTSSDARGLPSLEERCAAIQQALKLCGQQPISERQLQA
jgi:chemotaxis methyl-accepting protein methylase